MRQPRQDLELYREGKGNLPKCTKEELHDQICVFKISVAYARRMH